MGLSSLTLLCRGTLPSNYSRYTTPPNPGAGNGPLEGEIALSILGYQSNDTDVIIFGVQDSAGTSSIVSLNSDNSAINIQDVVSADGPQITSYYSVNFGEDTVTNDWTLSFSVALRDGKTSPYKFVKGKSDFPHH